MKNISTLNGIIIVLLVAAIAAGAVALVQKQPWSSQPLEITLAEPVPTAAIGDNCEREVPQKISINRADVSFLLTGDLYGDGELWLTSRSGGLHNTVLKVSHHGSDTSTCPEFLAAVDPQVAVICVGSDNRFGHPADEVMARLVDWVGDSNIYLTSERGTVTFTTDGERLWVETDG